MTTPEKPRFDPGDVHFLSGQVRPRWRQISSRPRVAVVVLLGVAIGCAAPHMPLGRVRVTDLATAGLAFSALSFGACITGAVLALTLPAQENSDWITYTEEGHRHSYYSDLIFVFTWSAAAQIGVVVVSAVALIAGGDNNAAPPGSWTSNRVLVGLAATIFFYALAQLWTVIETISQLGFVRISTFARHDSQGGKR